MASMIENNHTSFHERTKDYLTKKKSMLLQKHRSSITEDIILFFSSCVQPCCYNKRVMLNTNRVF